MLDVRRRHTAGRNTGRRGHTSGTSRTPARSGGRSRSEVSPWLWSWPPETWSSPRTVRRRIRRKPGSGSTTEGSSCWLGPSLFGARAPVVSRATCLAQFLAAARPGQVDAAEEIDTGATW